MKEVVDRLLASYPESEIGNKISDYIASFIERPDADGKLVQKQFDFLDYGLKEIAILYFNYRGQKYAFWQGPMKFIGLYKLDIHNGDVEISTLWLDMHPLLKSKNYKIFLDVYFNPIIKRNV